MTIVDIPEGNFNQLKALIISELKAVSTGLKELGRECRDNQVDTRLYIEDKFREWKELDDKRHAELDVRISSHGSEIQDLQGKVGLRGAIIAFVPVMLILVPLLYKVFWAGD